MSSTPPPPPPHWCRQLCCAKTAQMRLCPSLSVTPSQHFSLCGTEQLLIFICTAGAHFQPHFFVVVVVFFFLKKSLLVVCHIYFSTKPLLCYSRPKQRHCFPLSCWLMLGAITRGSAGSRYISAIFSRRLYARRCDEPCGPDLKPGLRR